MISIFLNAAAAGVLAAALFAVNRSPKSGVLAAGIIAAIIGAGTNCLCPIVFKGLTLVPLTIALAWFSSTYAESLRDANSSSCCCYQYIYKNESSLDKLALSASLFCVMLTICYIWQVGHLITPTTIEWRPLVAVIIILSIPAWMEMSIRKIKAKERKEWWDNWPTD